MYNISDLIVVIGTLVVIYNSQILKIDLIKIFPKIYETINKKIIFFINFVKFVFENNPMLHYYDSDNEEKKEDKKEEEKIEDKVKQKYEDRYLEKFKAFSNEFYFNELELEDEQKEYEKIKTETEKKKVDSISKILEKLTKINEIEDQCGILKNTDNLFTENLNNFGRQKIDEYFNLYGWPEDGYDEIEYYVDYERFYIAIIKDKNALNAELKEIDSKRLTNDELKEITRKTIINKKLDKFVNNYVLENTPMGNIYMRYNNNKGSFEYFSNKTIPYRYLEPVGRKYVMTYWCKPIFVDIEEELKRAEIKYTEDMKKKEEDEKRKQEEMKNNPRNVMARMKSYNKDTKNQTAIQPMKNRSSNNVPPARIKSSIQNVIQRSEKQLLKENANRYTWEGRLTDFCPLKKIDKKVVNKSLSMTYVDFKRMQQEQQNKK
jgi:hypothetical protein